jgi:Protein of unknown function (DUF1254)
VIYGFGFLDLRQEPVIVKAPDSNGLYYMVEICDMWTNAFAYIGGKATGTKAAVSRLSAQAGRASCRRASPGSTALPHGY